MSPTRIIFTLETTVTHVSPHRFRKTVPEMSHFRKLNSTIQCPQPSKDLRRFYSAYWGRRQRQPSPRRDVAESVGTARLFREATENTSPRNDDVDGYEKQMRCDMVMIMVLRSRRSARWIGHESSRHLPCVLEASTIVAYTQMLTIYR